MRILTAFLIFNLCSPLVNAQKLKETDAININSKFTLELTEKNSLEYTYRILSVEPFSEELQMSSVASSLDAALNVNQIQGVLTIGSFGNQKSVLLFLKSGINSPLDYSLFIDLKGKGKFKKTSTISINSAFPSTEIWQDYIHSIKIAEFRKAQIEPLEYVKLDTACISDIDFDQGNTLFSKQLNFVIEEFSNQDFFDIEKVKKYENAINSEDESPGNINAFTSSDGYIEKKRLAAPLSYKLLECPNLEREVLYFYNKKKEQVKLVLFQWRPRRIPNSNSNIGSKEELIYDFKSKHEFLRTSVIRSLGPPKNDELVENSGRLESEWQTKEGLIAKSYLFIYGNSYEIRLYLYLAEK